MRQLTISSLIIFLSMGLWGQNDFQSQFNNYRKELHRQYDAYRDSINRVFAKSIEENWVRFNTYAPVPVPQKPLPEMDVFTSREDSNVVFELEVDSIVPRKESSETLVPWHFQHPTQEDPRNLKIPFYGSTLQFHCFAGFSFRLDNLQEKTVAAAWQQLAETPYEGLISELVFYRDDMNLNDWGMYVLLKQIARTLYPSQNENQVVFSTFIMNQLGFRMKIGRCGNALIPLIAFHSMIYGIPFISIKDEKYYIMRDAKTEGGIYSYPIEYQNAHKCIDLQIQRPLRLALSLYTKQCQANGQSYAINLNKNLIEFFRTFPQTDIPVYANAPISNITRKSLEKELLPQLDGKTEPEAVNFLLQFVQTAFGYKNDIQQFGQEKFFFAEELFYYPYSDCEDRSVLFSQLVRRFLGLQVVLLDYPDHVTTAVRFSIPVQGDFVQIEGEKYVICDPTYLHAQVGQSIPRYKSQRAKIYILD